MTAGDPDRARAPHPPWPLILGCGAFLLVVLVITAATFRYVRVPDARALIGDAVVLAAWTGLMLAVWRWPSPAVDNHLARLGDWLAPRAGRLVAILAIAVVAAILLTATVTLQLFPNSGDEYAQLFQAATYLDGRVTNPMPPDEIANAFRTFFTYYHDGRWFGRYPPGWATLLAGSHALGLPYWPVNPCLGLVSFILLWRICDALALPPPATLLCLLLATANGFFVFNAASYFAHPLVLAGALLFVLFYLRWQQAPTWWSGVLAGVGLGIAGATRHLEAAVVALPPLIALIWYGPWTHRIRAVWILVGGAPFLLGLLWYNFAVTGDPLLPPMVWSIPNDTLRFFAADPDQHPLARAALFAAGRLITWAQWTSAPMVPLTALALVWLGYRRQLRFFDLYLPMLVIVLLFYWGYGGNQYGPRYYHLGLPFAALTIVRAAGSLIRDHPAPWLRVATLGLGLMVLVALINLVVWEVRVHRVVTDRRDLYRLVDQQGLADALVIVADSTSPANPMAPAELIRNGIDLRGRVVFALDVVDQATLRRHFGDRTFWRYERPGDQTTGRLVRLQPDSR